MMEYKVFTPIADLQPFVRCYWTLEGEATEKPAKQRVLPDGCMEMIIHYGDLYRQYFSDGSSIIQPRSFIFGQITNFIEIAPTGLTGLVAARFMPDGLANFLQTPVSTLENKAIDITKVFGRNGKLLEESVLSASGNTERLKLLESFLLSRLTAPQTINSITKNCVDIILQSRGQLDINELAGKMKVNRRNIERKFVAAIGLSPKQLSRVVRLQSALKMLGEKDYVNLTSLAYENGYYDQAHFIRDFKEFTGISPKSFFSGNLKLAALFASGE